MNPLLLWDGRGKTARLSAAPVVLSPALPSVTRQRKQRRQHVTVCFPTGAPERDNLRTLPAPITQARVCRARAQRAEARPDLPRAEGILWVDPFPPSWTRRRNVLSARLRRD